MKTRALLLALPLLALACRDNSASVQIQAICYPPDDCKWDNACDRVLAGEPLIDTALGTSLDLMLQVGNQLPDNADLGLGRTNTNDAHVDEVEVEYEGVAIPQQIRLTNQRVPANSTQLIGTLVVPPGYSGALTAIVSQGVATVRMRGYYDDGTRFETAEFPIAFEVCTGCLSSCLPKAACGGDGQLPKTCFDPDSLSST